jgi:hypothetical protein
VIEEKNEARVGLVIRETATPEPIILDSSKAAINIIIA